MPEQRDDLVEQVKERNRIEQVIAEDGYPLDGKRGRYQICRQHDSLVVDVANQAYHWNSKSEHGDVIAWRMARAGVDFKTAVEGLCERARMPAPMWGREDAATRVMSRQREDAWSAAASVFVRWLWRTPDALGYARSRGWTDETLQRGLIGYTGAGSARRELIEEMKGAWIEQGIDVTTTACVAIIGFRGNVAQWGMENGVKPREEWVKDGYIPGLIGRDMMVYPHLRRGRVGYFSGRGVHEKVHYNLPVELAGERQPYFNTAWSSAEAECVVVEGQADAVSLAQWGIAGLALAGTAAGEALTDLLKGHGVIYLGLDGDKAGKVAELKVARALGPMVRLVEWRSKQGSASEEEEGEGEGQEQAEIKDANDLLKRLNRIHADGEQQATYVRGLLAAAKTHVEMVCEAAGQRKGAERDGAQQAAFALVARMDKVALAQYRTRLAKALGLPARDFDHILKTVLASKDKLNPMDAEPVYTWGGFIDGWLVEYLYDVESGRASLAWRDADGVIDSGGEVVIDGRRYLPYPPTHTMETSGVIFPSAVGEQRTIKELVAYIELFLRSIYLMPSDRITRLIAYWVMSTWLYDCFETVIYLRAIGGAGSGKSELMKRIGLICYRTMTANGAGSTASLFRSVERYKGTVFIDEADIQNSDTEDDMIKFYNLGAMRNNPIWRTIEVTGPNGEKTWEEVGFQTFCPKLVAMRKDFKDDAVGSRSLTLKLTSREMIELRTAQVPLNITGAMRQRAQALRNLLCRWRLENWQREIEVDYEYYDMSISARLNQVAGPLLAIAREDPDQQEDIRSTLRGYYAESIITQSMTLAARVLEAMWKIWKYPDLHKAHVKMDGEGQSMIKVGVITEIANQLIDEMNNEEEGDEERPGRNRGLKPHRVGGILRNEFSMQMSQRMRDGFWVYWNEPRMLGLSMKHGIRPEDFGPQGEEKKATQGKMA